MQLMQIEIKTCNQQRYNNSIYGLYNKFRFSETFQILNNKFSRNFLNKKKISVIYKVVVSVAS